MSDKRMQVLSTECRCGHLIAAHPPAAPCTVAGCTCQEWTPADAAVARLGSVNEPVCIIESDDIDGAWIIETEDPLTADKLREVILALARGDHVQ